MGTVTSAVWVWTSSSTQTPLPISRLGCNLRTHLGVQRSSICQECKAAEASNSLGISTCCLSDSEPKTSCGIRASFGPVVVGWLDENPPVLIAVSSPQLHPSENHTQAHEMNNKPTSQSKQTCHHVICPVTKFAEMAQAVHCSWTHIYLHSTLIAPKLNKPSTSKNPFNTISPSQLHHMQQPSNHKHRPQ
jgi:hypothetical protein